MNCKRSLFVLVIALLIIPSVFASDKIEKIDSTIRQEIGDSMAVIVLDADSIRTEVMPWMDQKLEAKILPLWMAQNVKYTLCQPFMYQTNKKVYTDFVADVCLSFSGTKGVLRIELDYNCFKWRIIDSVGKEICRHDLCHRELLPMLYMLYSESKLLKIKFDRYLQNYEK